MPRPIKPFLNYEQQIRNLADIKGLTITSESFAKSILKSISYYSLIGGYKSLFYNCYTHQYHPGTKFEEIVALYNFDDSLRNLFFRYICRIEQKILSCVSHSFTEVKSNLHTDYLNPLNYENTRRNRSNITKLIGILSHIVFNDVNHDYIVYQRNTYGNVPLWATMKVLTFGQKSTMLSLLPSRIKSKVSHNYTNVNERELIQYLRFLTDIRNVCAHNERLYNHIDPYTIPNTKLHIKLGIPMINGQYAKGKHDLFAVVIAFKYLLDRQDFIEFKTILTRSTKNISKKLSTININTLLDIMGFPQNWHLISRFKT